MSNLLVSFRSLLAAAAIIVVVALGLPSSIDAACTGTVLTGTLSSVILTPGTYCFDAAATLTGAVTLNGPSNGNWNFFVGSGGLGALTATDFTVNMAGGAVAENVQWSVAGAVTLTRTLFVGSINALAAITVTDSTVIGCLFSQISVVTLTRSTATLCTTTTTAAAMSTTIVASPATTIVAPPQTTKNGRDDDKDDHKDDDDKDKKRHHNDDDKDKKRRDDDDKDNKRRNDDDKDNKRRNDDNKGERRDDKR
jgi:hypothetical protein